MAINGAAVAVALRALADAFEESPAESAAPAAAPKRGRGRPVVGEALPGAPAAPNATPAATVAAQAAPTATTPTTAEDPFATPAPAVPTATIEEVRAALTALKAATTQENALAVLKTAGGADNLPSLKPESYGAVVAAAKAALPGSKPAPEPDDPFALPAAAAAEKPPTIEELKALIIETQKRTSQDAVMKLVMMHGGKAKNPDSGVEGPSLKALPAESYGVVAAALKALPSTK